MANVLYTKSGLPVDDLNALPVKIAGADPASGSLSVTTQDIIPIDIQSRLATTIQTHNAVNVAGTGTTWSTGSWINCDGFTDVGLTLKNDATTNSSIDIEWSHDGATIHGKETGIANSASSTKAGLVSVKAMYCRLVVNNGDATLAHTMSAWAYLKA